MGMTEPNLLKVSSQDDEKSNVNLTLTLSKSFRSLTCLGITVCLSSSCGILGEKKAASRTLAQSGGACLDELGPLAEQYLDGSVSEAKWASTWECVDDTIDLFKKFVKGSEADGYVADDVRLLMQKFLFSKTTVSPRFVESVLSVKASIFGGTSRSLSKAQLDDFRALTRFIKTESLVLLPHLRNRRQDPSPKNLRAFADAVGAFGIRFADYLKTDGNMKLTTEMAEQFIAELAAASSASDPAKAKQWARFLQEIKVLLVHGAEDGIAGGDWNKMLRFGFRFGGAFLAYTDFKDNDPLFQIEMVDRIHEVLKGSLAEWGGVLPYSQFEKIIDSAPRALLPRLANDFKIGMKALIHPRPETHSDGTITKNRPALSRLFQAKGDLGIEASSVQMLVNSFHTGMRTHWHLSGIFSGGKEDLTPAEFETRAKAYAGRLPTRDQSEVIRLITLANRYSGLHPSSTPEILFGDQNRHSINNLNRMSWYEIAAGLLLEGYGTGANTYGKAGTLSDLDTLILDLSPFLFSMGMVHPKKTGVGAKRFREANLFMPNGDGNDLMDLPETSVYMAFLFSSGSLTSRITTTALAGKEPCPIQGWNVNLKIPVYEVHCFRNRFLGNFKDLMVNMPRLQDDYNVMNQAAKDEFYKTLEYASKYTGYNDDPVSEFDMSSFAGLPHFAESVMTKFDKNHDGALDRRETIDYVFPVFKRELSIISKIKIDFVNKAVLLYLMQYGKEPKIKDLLTWALGFEFLKDFNARRIRIYQVFAALGPPIAGDPISQTPPADLNITGTTSLGFILNSLIRGLTPTGTSSLAAEPQTLSEPPTSSFDLDSVDPAQLTGYSADGPVIDPSSPYQEALEVLPQDL